MKHGTPTPPTSERPSSRPRPARPRATLIARRAGSLGALLGLVAIGAAGFAHADGARQQSTVVVPSFMKQAYEGWGYAPAIVTRDGTIYVSGVVVGLTGTGSYEERYAAGFERALDAIDRILREAGASLDDVVDITSFHTDIARQLETAVKVRMKRMAAPHPAWTAVGTTGLAVPDGVTEIRVIAKRRDGG